MGRTGYLAGGLLALAIGAAAITYVGRDVPGAPVVPQAPTIAQGTLPGNGAATLSQAPGRPQLAELDRLIRSFGAQTDDAPSAAGFAFLGQLELQRARLTGDVDSYARARRALEEAVALAPEDPEPRALLAGVRFTTHDFTGALCARHRDLRGRPEPERARHPRRRRTRARPIRRRRQRLRSPRRRATRGIDLARATLAPRVPARGR